MENHVCFFILTNCEAILNKLLIVCIAYILKHILDFILIYIFWTLWSLTYNLKTDKYTDRFLDAYGRDNIDSKALKAVLSAEMFG